MAAPAGTVRVTPILRDIFSGTVIVNGGYDARSANAAIARGETDLVAFGVPFLANPDLPARYRGDRPLNAPDFKHVLCRRGEGLHRLSGVVVIAIPPTFHPHIRSRTMDSQTLTLSAADTEERAGRPDGPAGDGRRSRRPAGARRHACLRRRTLQQSPARQRVRLVEAYSASLRGVQATSVLTSARCMTWSLSSAAQAHGDDGQ